MKKYLLLVLLITGCQSLPVTQGQLEQVRKEALEDRKNLYALAKQQAPNSPATALIGAAVKNYEVQSINPWEEWLNMGLGMALTSVLGVGGLGANHMRKKWKNEDPNA